MTEQTQEQTKQSWFPLIVIVFSMMMMYTTSFGINVLIAPIVQEFKWNISGLQLVIVSASLIAGSFQVTAGRLGDKLGKKKIFLWGNIIYTIGIIIVVLAPNSLIFSLGWALIWPFGMVLIIPTMIALIMYYYTGEQRAIAFGVYGGVLSIISAGSPLLVGLLSNELGWRIGLALSPLFGLFTILLTFKLPETTKDENIKIDIPSVFLSVFAFALFLIATTFATQYGWFFEKRAFLIGEFQLPLAGFSIVPVLYLISFVLLAIFFQRGKALSAKGEDPLLDGAIFKIKTFTLGATIQSILYFLLAAFIFTFSVFVQSAAGFDSFSTALVTLPASAGVGVFALFTSSLGQKIAPKWIIFFGFALSILGMYLLMLAVSVTATPLDFVPGMSLFGIGLGLVTAQIATVTMSDIKEKDEGSASGLSETMKEIIGQGFAIAFAGAILFGAVYSNMVDSYIKVESVKLSETQQSKIIVELEDTFNSITPVKEKEFIKSLPEKTQNSYQEIVNSAAEKALQKTVFILAFFSVLAMILSLFLPNIKLRKGN